MRSGWTGRAYAPAVPPPSVMLTLHPDLFVVVQQVEGPRSPMPRPLDSGFSLGCAYRVLGVHAPSETGEAYFILSNDRDEVWFVSNRHFRAHALVPGTTALRLPSTASGDGVAHAAPMLDLGRHAHSSSL